MQFRYNYTTTATIKRQSYTADKSTYATVAGTVFGYFGPTTPTEGVGAQTIISQAYQFVTDGPNDIRANDRLVIDSVEYGVKGVQRFTQLSQDVLICTLNKSVKK